MAKFVISTDTCADMFISEMEQKGISYIPMAYLLDGVPHFDVYNSDEEVDEFYKMIAAGKLPTTSMVNTEEATEFLSGLLAEKKQDIIHFALSGGLSGTADNVKAAAEEINKKSGNKVYVVDTVCATAGMALLINRCIEMQKAGKTAADAFGEMEKLKYKVHHWVIVDDLYHLKRGGRVSGASAFLGSILKIKPILSVTRGGKLQIAQKALGQKKAIEAVIDAVKKYGEDIPGQTVYISNTTDKELCETIRARLVSEFGCKVSCGRIGPVIGSHTGCGTLAVIFVGKERA